MQTPNKLLHFNSRQCAVHFSYMPAPRFRHLLLYISSPLAYKHETVNILRPFITAKTKIISECSRLRSSYPLAVGTPDIDALTQRTRWSHVATLRVSVIGPCLVFSRQTPFAGACAHARRLRTFVTSLTSIIVFIPCCKLICRINIIPSFNCVHQKAVAKYNTTHSHAGTICSHTFVGQ